MSAAQMQKLITCRRASAAVEFALVLPALAMLVVGTFSAGLVMYSISGMHSAVEAAARCYSVNSGQCSSASLAATYAQNHYYGVGTPNFTATTPACGYQVSGSLNINFSAGIANWAIPVSAASCFP